MSSCRAHSDPDNSGFLSEDERIAIKEHLSSDAPTMTERFSWQQIRELFKTPSFIPFTMIWVTHGIGGWGISFILPSVIYELGLSNTAIAQVMTMPPYTLVFVFLLSLAFLVQRKVINAFVAGLILEIGQIVCYILLLTVKNSVAKYIFVMIATAAGQSLFPIIWPERIRAAKGTTAAGLAIGVTNVGPFLRRFYSFQASCQLMGIVGPQIYNLKFGPTYHVSYSASIGLLCGSVVAIIATWWTVARSRKVEDAEQALDFSQDNADTLK